MKLSEWARRNGVHYQTAWQWARDGKMPVPVVKTATGRYMVLDQTAEVTGRTVAYCRVSGTDQLAELDRQAARVVAATTGMGLTVTEVVGEVGSGMDGDRPKLARLLRDASVGVIVVERRDRLARFGLEQLSAALEATGRRIVVIDDTEGGEGAVPGARVDDELLRDMAEVLTSLCARLYGRRSAARRARAALRAAFEAA
ncbi:IS607 family transposase [Nonomuraea sp. NEAU-A123]|uniref:IS607 family transposase n=1 Tax=Nonomuraea sp. NEAU-A123 TaxID=2839649 RepID=UPI001BE3FD72|nr:IS607 family transposase [Nonomuraea sp. NEAU-A123]MBT2228881.1 IS607 family transposase [Nonomuraea sp. NEAU-A123]